MLSFWPSFSLLVFFLVIFLECRVIGGRVTLSLGSFLMMFCYGAIGAPLIALLLQQIPALADGGGTVAWLAGPPIEELAKALPVIVLAFLTRESRRLSIADLTLIGFASGAGFGFVEGNLNALVTGTLPSVQHWAAFGLQTQDGVVFFAGHPVSTALVGLAAGVGLRFLPPNIWFAWVPAVFVMLWASFDHGLYNWKVLSAGSTGVLPDAHITIELLHKATLHGQLATWVLPLGLVAAQLLEALLCSRAAGRRRDLLLAREWRAWVINEWLVALMRAPRGRAAFGQTLGYFRLRRSFFLATLEARRDPKDPTLSRHARSLDERLKRERSILFDPQPGTWLLPLPVLKTYAARWTWRMRWVLVFAVLFFLLFMVDPASLPESLREIVFGKIFTSIVVTAGLAFAVWRIILFGRLTPPDPLAADSEACAVYHTRTLLLGCSLMCGLFPTLALLLGWNAVAPGAAFISGYLPGWIAQGGNLQTLLGLGTIGAAVAPDPRPAGEALRHEIAAGDERIRRLNWRIEEKAGGGDDRAPPVQLDAFLDTMAKLDAERDAQARRQLALDECARRASEGAVKDPTAAVQAVKDEFDRLADELIETAAKELDAIATLEQAYGRAWSEIMQDLDAHDALRRTLTTPLRQAWQAQNDIAWALRVVDGADDSLLPMQLTLLAELQAVAATARDARVEKVAAGIERIRAAAGLYSEADPFAFAVEAGKTAESEAAPPAEVASEPAAEETPKPFGLRASPTIEPPAPLADDEDLAAEVEAPKPFGLRTPKPTEPPAPSADDEDLGAEVETPQPATPDPVLPRGQHYQEALDQLIDATNQDTRYLETIRDLERSHESLRQPVEPKHAEPQPLDEGANAVLQDEVERHQPQPDTAEKLPKVASDEDHQGGLEDIIDAIKRDSGYLAFKEPQPTPVQDDRDQAAQADTALEADKAAPPVEQVADEPAPSLEVEATQPDTAKAESEIPNASGEPLVETPREAETPTEAPEQERAEEVVEFAPVAPPPAEEPAVAPAARDQSIQEPETAQSITEPATNWLAELGSPSADEGTAKPGDVRLEPIEWPALSRTAQDDVHAQSADADDVAPAAETSADPSKTAGDDVSAQPSDSAPSASETATGDAQKPPDADEFSSKVDRLSDLLTKLESAMQAKIAAVATPPQEDARPLPREADQAAAPLSVASTIEAKPETSSADAPSEQTPKRDEPGKIAPLPVEPPAAAVDAPATVQPHVTAAEPPVVPVEAQAATAEPSGVQSKAPEMAHGPVAPSADAGPSRPAHDSTAGHLEPDRLSDLLTKLFHAVKERPAEQIAGTDGAAPVAAAPPAKAPIDKETSDDILDLRHATDSRAVQAVDVEPPEIPAQVPPVAQPASETAPEIEHRATPASISEPTNASPIAEQASIDIAPAAVDAKPASAEPPKAAKDEPETQTSREPQPTPPQPQVVESPDTSSAAPAQPSTFRSKTRSIQFESRAKAPSAKSIEDAEAKDSVQHSPEPAGPATAPAATRRDWKIGGGSPSRGREGRVIPKDATPVLRAHAERPRALQREAEGETSVKKSDTSVRVKLHTSGALATVETAPPALAAASGKTPAKYYGPRYVDGEDGNNAGNTTAQQRALSLTDALTEYFAKTAEAQPPMHTTDRATLQRAITGGKLEAPLRRGAPWSTSGMSRRGEVVIRLKPGSQQFVEFVPSKELFGQIPHYYPRGVGKGSFVTYVPTVHLEYFDLATRRWASLERG